MAHAEVMAARVRVALARKKGIIEKKMFGGVCFMVDGHMCCGIAGSDLVLRLGDAGAAAALEEPHTRGMDFTGRVMKSLAVLGRDLSGRSFGHFPADGIDSIWASNVLKPADGGAASRPASCLLF